MIPPIEYLKANQMGAQKAIVEAIGTTELPNQAPPIARTMTPLAHRWQIGSEFSLGEGTGEQIFTP